MNCCSGRMRRMEPLEYRPTAAAPKNRPISRLSAPRAIEYIRLPIVMFAPNLSRCQVCVFGEGNRGGHGEFNHANRSLIATGITLAPTRAQYPDPIIARP